MVGMAKRLAVFAYGLVSYLVFFLTFVYAVGFIGNLYVPKSMDSTARTSFLPALVVDALLLLIFAVQHSLMAQPAFKEVLTRFIPAAAERSTCVLCSSLLLIVVFAFWQPIGGVVWNVTNPVVRNAINAAFGFGFALVFVATLLINHFDLFGLRQVALYLARKPYTYLEFRTPLFYRYVRHPENAGKLVRKDAFIHQHAKSIEQFAPQADFLVITKQPSLVHIEEVITKEVLGHRQTAGRRRWGHRKAAGPPHSWLFYQQIRVPVPGSGRQGCKSRR
jgi:methanethiol S-methyltransferase